MKINIRQEQILPLPNFQNPFELEIDASGYSMGVVLMQGGRLLCYHSKIFHGEVISYRTYDKELYALVKFCKRWKHYMMGKETIIHIDHHPLQYLQVRYNKPIITNGWIFYNNFI
jgi:hypothetical protein